MTVSLRDDIATAVADERASRECAKETCAKNDSAYAKFVEDFRTAEAEAIKAGVEPIPLIAGTSIVAHTPSIVWNEPQRAVMIGEMFRLGDDVYCGKLATAAYIAVRPWRTYRGPVIDARYSYTGVLMSVRADIVADGPFVRYREYSDALPVDARAWLARATAKAIINAS